MNGQAKKRLGELLIEAGVIDETQLRAALGYQRQWGVRLGQALVDLKLASEQDVVRVMAKRFGYEVARLDQVEPHAHQQALSLVPRDFAVKNNVFPLSADIGSLAVAMSDPTNLAVVDELRFRTGRKLKISIAGEREITRAVKAAYPKQDGDVEAIALDVDDSDGEGEPLLTAFGGGSSDAYDSFFGAGPTQGAQGSQPAPPAAAARPPQLAPQAPVAAPPAPQAAPAPQPAAPAPAAAAPARQPAPPAARQPAPSPTPTAPRAVPAPAPGDGPPVAPRVAPAMPANLPRPGTAPAHTPTVPSMPVVAAPAPAPAPAAVPGPVAPRPAAPGAPPNLAPAPARPAAPVPAARPAAQQPAPSTAVAQPAPPEALPSPDALRDARVLREGTGGSAPASPLTPDEQAMLAALERLAAGGYAEPEVLKPTQVIAVVVRLLLDKGIISQRELLHALRNDAKG